MPETLLIPLWARAVEQSRPAPLIVDPDAARMVESLDYDFSQFSKKRVSAENFCVRSRVVDDVVLQHLAGNPGTPVVEFGAGLDTRFRRVGHAAKSWLEVDLPEVASLRREFLGAEPNRKIVAASMLETDWIAACPESDRPPLFVAEGVLYFFSRQQIGRLLGMLGRHFPGASLVFDAVSPAWLRLSNLRHPLADSRLQFCLSPGATEIPELCPGWSIAEYVGFGDSPWYDSLMPRFSWWKRAAARLLPPARHAFMVVQARASDTLSGSRL